MEFATRELALKYFINTFEMKQSLHYLKLLNVKKIMYMIDIAFHLANCRTTILMTLGQMRSFDANRFFYFLAHMGLRNY